MCGIVGCLDFSHKTKSNELQEWVTRSVNILAHRGPDSGGSWVDPKTGIALGHRRLAILDLSSQGFQPMLSACGRYVLIFNGEVYNFLELRKELEHLGHSFQSHSDTEVIIVSFSQWGVQAAVQRFVGMFAFALWDRQEQVLYLGRDRLGEKPLYYGWVGNIFLFGSELKALRSHSQWRGEINRNALSLLLRYTYIPDPYSIYQDIYKLPSATILTLPYTNAGSTPAPVSYWSFQEVATASITNPFVGSDTEAVEHLETLLQETVRHQIIADVPLGAFLSGGVDSSTIVGLMQVQSNQPIKTFTLGFHEDTYNEATYAQAIADHFGTDHTELYVTLEDVMSIIPRLPQLYDEPFADSSQIPTFLVAQLAKQQVTVSLSGDGGDELFGGYHHYKTVFDIWNKNQRIPLLIRQNLSKLLSPLSSVVSNRVLEWFDPLLDLYGLDGKASEKLYKLSGLISLESLDAIYLWLISEWKEPKALLLDASEPPTAQTALKQCGLNKAELIQQMLYLDTVTYLPGNILVKVDRATMGVGLESRMPFLDHRIVEFVWSLPIHMKIRGTQTKWLLRQILYKYVPQHLIERPKMGFGLPLDNLLRGPLYDWAEALLDEHRLKNEGFLKPELIRRKWQEHLSGNVCNWGGPLWPVLMFQAWIEQEQS